MPRPTRDRKSLPSHAAAVKLAPASASTDLPAFSSNPFDESIPAETVVVRPPTKQKKADKAYHKREAFLAKITEGTNPYSKSHNRREKRAKRPDQNLVTDLSTVEEVLLEMNGAGENETDQASELSTRPGLKEVLPGGKGKEKLTGKKRQRVLADEAIRLPAIMSNPAFASDPFNTIRLHTLNTMAQMQSVKSIPKRQQLKKLK